MDSDEEDGFVTIDLDSDGKTPEVLVEEEKKKIPPEPKAKDDEDEEGGERGIDTDEGERRRRPSKSARLKVQRDRAFAEIQKEREKTAALEARLAALEDKSANDTKANRDYNLKAVNDSLTLAKQRLQDAIDKGNAGEAAELQEMVSTLVFDKRVLEANQAREAPPKPDGNKTTQSNNSQGQPPAIHPKIADWVDDNPWFNKSQAMRAAAIALDAELRSDGYSYDDPEFFEELDKRLDGILPNRRPGAKKSAPIVGKPGRTSDTTTTNRVRLSAEEVREAKRLGVDLKVYAARKRDVDMADSNGYTNIL